MDVKIKKIKKLEDSIKLLQNQIDKIKQEDSRRD